MISQRTRRRKIPTDARVRVTRATSPASPATPTRGIYEVYGQRIRSDVPLPCAPADVARRRAAPGSAGVTIVRGSGALMPPPEETLRVAFPCPRHGMDQLVYRQGRQAWIWRREAGWAHIAADASTVTVYPEAATDASDGTETVDALGHVLLQPVLPHLLQLRGRPLLHGGALVIGNAAIGFLGASGQGKSTLIAALLQRGAALLADDVLPLDEREGDVMVASGPPHLKLWPDSTHAVLRCDDELPRVMSDSDKRLLPIAGRYSHATGAYPLRRLYVLARYDPEAAGRTSVEMLPLRGGEKLAALMAHLPTRDYLLPAEEAAFLPRFARLAARLPVYVLRYPSGYAHQPATCAHLLDNLEAR